MLQKGYSRDNVPTNCYRRGSAWRCRRGCSCNHSIDLDARRRVITYEIYSAVVVFCQHTRSRGGSPFAQKRPVSFRERLCTRPMKVTWEVWLSEGNRTEEKAAVSRAAREGHSSLRPSSLFIWRIRRIGRTDVSPPKINDIYRNASAGTHTERAVAWTQPGGSGRAFSCHLIRSFFPACFQHNSI